MVTLNKLEEFIPSSIYDALEKESLFTKLLKEVKRQMTTFGIAIHESYILPIDLYIPVAHMLTYLTSMKNIEGISDTMLKIFLSNYNAACNQIKTYAANSMTPTASTLTIESGTFTNSEYNLR